MLFTIYFENGQTTTIDTENISKAHKEGEKISAVAKCYADTSTTEGLQAAALTIVKRTTAHMIEKECTTDQYRLYLAAKCKPVTDPDVLDMISVATLALWEAIQEGKNIVEQNKTAYKALNKYLYRERRVDTAKTAGKTVYIEALNGDIVNVNKEEKKILNLTDPYTPIPVLIENPAIQAEKAAVIRDIVDVATEQQKKVLYLTANGLTERQIAKKINRQAGTVADKLKRIRTRGAKLYPNIADKYKRWNKTTVDNSNDNNLDFGDFEKLMQNDF